jgi:hypothetical protein
MILRDRKTEMWTIIYSIRAARRFRGYRPKPLSFLSARRWMRQFFGKDRKLAKRLLDNVVYMSESKSRDILVEQNAALMRRLNDAGLSPEKLIYVSVDEAASSSPVLLNLLRDTARLKRLGCKFIDGRDLMGLNQAMNELGEGALIYVDDFVGSGIQFCEARDFTADFVDMSTFSEFIIAPCICEEAYEKLEARGIEAFTGHKHLQSQRPLHSNSTLFTDEERKSLLAICERISSRGLGFMDMGVMVVPWLNAPDNVPIILRGSQDQTPFVGIFPRTTDLPVI